MYLQRLRARHWRHEWEFVDNPASGGLSRRCLGCGRFKVYRGSAARRAGAEPHEGFVIGF